MIHYPFFINDYRAATRHLKPVEHGIYLLLINELYETEKPLPHDLAKFYRHNGIDTDLIPTCETILEDYFIKTDDGWRHKRVLEELEKYEAIVSKKAKAGKASAVKRAANKSATDGQQKLNTKQTGDEQVSNTCSTGVQHKGNQSESESESESDSDNRGIPPKPPTRHSGKSAKKFIKPSIEQLQAFITEKGYTVNPTVFFNHYEANGWKVGKNPMKSWQAALANWNARNSQQPAKTSNRPSVTDELNRIFEEIDQEGAHHG